jgi:hypothetical protein
MILLLCLLFCSSVVSAKIMLVDKIDKIVCGPIANTPISHTDIDWKRSLTGEAVPVAKQIQMEIVRQQVEQEKIPIDESTAVQYLETIKSANDLTQNQLVDLFGEVGLLYDEGKKQLVDQYTYDMFLHHKFRSQVLVTDDQVEEFHKNNPEIDPGLFEIKIATVSYDEDTKKAVRKKLDAFTDGDTGAITVEWGDILEIEDTELSRDKKFIASMKKDEMSVVDNDVEFDIYYLVSKKEARTKELQERRTAIIESLSREKFEGLLKSYNAGIEDKIRLIELF